MASFLAAAMAGHIEPVIFSAGLKSELGFALLGAAETGRVAVYAGDSPTIHEFWTQM